MWEKRQSQQVNFLRVSNQNTKMTPQQTPRNKVKPNVPLPNSRRSITPSRVQQRVTTSPLRMPLERAIQKCTRERSNERPSSKSRLTNKSSTQRDSSVILRRGMFQEDESIDKNTRVSDQTVDFLKRYFDLNNAIPYDQFVDRIIHFQPQFWEHEKAESLIDKFTFKVIEIFGQYIEPRQLLYMTRDQGIIGLILEIFRSMNENQDELRTIRSQYTAFSKSPNIMSINRSFEEQVSQCVNVQHLKNILQQFMETMYREMQKEIYDKFNVEMKRMVMKHREADRTIKKIQEKLTNHADYFDAEKKWKNKTRQLEQYNQEMTKKLEKKQAELNKQRDISNELKAGRGRLQEEIKKLKESNEKYQNILLQRFENLPPNEPNYPSTPSMINHSRKTPSNGPLLERTPEINNQNNSFINEPKPFQIKIDTHFIHRQVGPPNTHTTTTFMEQNLNGPPPSPIYPLADSNPTSRCYSPIKLSGHGHDGGRPSFDGGLKPGTKIGDYIYSPYQGKSSRLY